MTIGLSHRAAVINEFRNASQCLYLITMDADSSGGNSTCPPGPELTVCDTPPASPLLDQTTYDDLVSKTPRVRLVSGCSSECSSAGSSSSSLDDLGVHLEIGEATHDSHHEVAPPGPDAGISLPDTPPADSFSGKMSDALVYLLGPSSGQDLTPIDVEDVDNVLPECCGPDSNQGNSLLSIDSLLEDNPLLSDDSDTEGNRESGNFVLPPIPKHTVSNCRYSKNDNLVKHYRQKGDDKDDLKILYSNCIRDELNLKIRFRRLKHGQEDISLDHTTPEPTISYEAIQRRNYLRLKNRMYAQRSRDRATVRQLRLENEHRELFIKRELLKKQLSDLKSKCLELKCTIEEHIATCSKKCHLLSEASIKMVQTMIPISQTAITST